MPVGFRIQQKRLKLDDQCAIQKVPHAGSWEGVQQKRRQKVT